MRLKLPSKNIRHNTTVTRIFNGISRFRISPWGIKLCRNAQIPTTTSPLKIFEPTTLLMAISLLPASAALMLTEASGALVPMATMVSPMMTLGTFRIPAREELPSTKKSAPLIRSINPTSNNMYSISCPFLQQASVFLEKSIKIEILAFDRKNLALEITNVFMKNGINIKELQTEVTNNKAKINIVAEIRRMEQVDKLSEELIEIPNMIRVIK